MDAAARVGLSRSTRLLDRPFVGGGIRTSSLNRWNIVLLLCPIILIQVGDEGYQFGYGLAFALGAVQIVLVGDNPDNSNRRGALRC